MEKLLSQDDRVNGTLSVFEVFFCNVSAFVKKINIKYGQTLIPFQLLWHSNVLGRNVTCRGHLTPITLMCALLCMLCFPLVCTKLSKSCFSLWFCRRLLSNICMWVLTFPPLLPPPPITSFCAQQQWAIPLSHVGRWHVTYGTFSVFFVYLVERKRGGCEGCEF